MSEQIQSSPEEMYKTHKELTDQVIRAQNQDIVTGIRWMQARRDLKDKKYGLSYGKGRLKDYVRREEDLKRSLDVADDKLGIAKMAVASQVKTSKKFVGEHLDEFINEAAQDAAKDGVELTIPQQPQEVSEPFDQK